MRLAVNATRMELLRLKRRVTLAYRGHRLLKDKQDELMRQFLPLVEAARSLRREAEEGLSRAWQSFCMARAVMSAQYVGEAIIYPRVATSVALSGLRIMNLETPKLTLQMKGELYSYGFVNTSWQLDATISLYCDLLGKLVKLAEVEKRLEMMASEIERTRRRVNALEYILIPNLNETIKYIGMKLEEIERGNLTRLMKIKEMVRAR